MVKFWDCIWGSKLRCESDGEYAEGIGTTSIGASFFLCYLNLVFLDFLDNFPFFFLVHQLAVPPETTVAKQDIN